MAISSSDYRRWDAVEMARLVRDGEVGPGDLAETARTLIEDLRPLNVVACLAEAEPDAVGAATPARAADRAAHRLR